MARPRASDSSGSPCSPPWALLRAGPPGIRCARIAGRPLGLCERYSAAPLTTRPLRTSCMSAHSTVAGRLLRQVKEGRRRPATLPVFQGRSHDFEVTSTAGGCWKRTTPATRPSTNAWPLYAASGSDELAEAADAEGRHCARAGCVPRFDGSDREFRDCEGDDATPTARRQDPGETLPPAAQSDRRAATPPPGGSG
jgi:hypothetical protein